jgi:predicted ATPase/class 3 adenylate cyclase
LSQFLENGTLSMSEFPSGTVTFLFTDIEGSTKRWEANSPAMLNAVEYHIAILDEVISTNFGVRFKVIGDAVQAAFPTAHDALVAAVVAQRQLTIQDWGGVDRLAVRMALHTGTATPRDGDYLAPCLNRLARLLSASAGGQILLSEATRNLVRDELPVGVALIDLGEHRLRDIHEKEHVYQVTAAGLPQGFPPLKSLDAPLTNLPVQLTSFVGRERDIAEITRLLADPTVHLLTLTGPGGTGKTRLALRVGADLVRAYKDGVWFVALAPITNAHLILSAIAEALGVREITGEPLVQTLCGYLSQKRLLLILDNFEHLVAAARYVSDLLANCPSLQILATSRGPLRITGEHALSIEPLTMPEAAPGVSSEDAMRFEAVRLFVERAQAARANFVIDERNAAAIVAICRRLDGLPLAIELAAARMRLLSLEALLTRLDSSLTLLTSGDRDRPERQQTLRAAIAWSYDLLGHEEQALFRRLAVFVGGWTLEAAEAIATQSPAIRSTLDSLGALAENSLIQPRNPLRPMEHAEPRFVMLETIREFAEEQLAASEERTSVERVHAAFFLDLAITAEPHLTGPEAITWLIRLDADHENLSAALEHFRREGNGDRAVAMAAALWRFWWLRGHITEGRGELEETLALQLTMRAPRELAVALDGAGVLAETQGDYDRAELLHQRALQLARTDDDRESIARSLGNLGVIAADRGEFERAAELLSESLYLARVVGQAHLVATALNDLGGVAHSRGDLTRAEELYRESLAIRRKSGSGSDIARTLNNLGFISLAMQAFSKACAYFEESLALYRENGDKWGIAGPLYGLAMASLPDDPKHSTDLLEESLALFREAGDARNAANAWLNLGSLALSSRDVDRALESYREALSGFYAVDDLEGITEALSGAGRAYARRGEHATATHLLAAAAALSDADQPPGSPGEDDPDLESARSVLGENGFMDAWRSGRGLSVEEAIAEACGPRTIG